MLIVKQRNAKFSQVVMLLVLPPPCQEMQAYGDPSHPYNTSDSWKQQISNSGRCRGGG